MPNADLDYKIINQGQYGCIAFPGPPCPNKKPNSKYITKVQKLTTTAERETVIGQKIKKSIKAYQQYFAPIIETCDIDLSVIDESELNKCEFIQMADQTQNLPKYKSNRIRYVGKLTLADYLKSQLTVRTNPKSFMTKYINSQLVLLEGLKKLAAINIIHFDIKENNILCRDDSGRPILIDFGLSFDTTQIKNPVDVFIAYSPEYGPWCIEICFLTYMSTRLDREQTVWKSKIATITEITNIIDDFIKQNSAVQTILKPEQQEQLRTKFMEYFKRFDQTIWQTVYDELMQYSKTWDNYGIAVIYLYLLSDLQLEPYIEKYPYLHAYRDLLLQILMANPDERIGVTDTITKINGIFSSIKRTENNKFKKELKVDVQQPTNNTNRIKSVANEKLAELRRERQIYNINA